MHVVILCKSLRSQHCGFIKPLEDSTRWSATAALSKQRGIRFFHILFFFTLQWALSLPVVMCVRGTLGLYFLCLVETTQSLWTVEETNTWWRSVSGPRLSPFLLWQHKQLQEEMFFLLCKYVRSDVSFSLHQYIHIISTSQACLLVRELHHAAAASQPPTSVSSPDEPCDHVLTHVDRHRSPGYSEIFGLPVHILLASGWWCHSASSVHRVWSSHWSLFVSEPMCRLVTWGACVSLQQCTPASRTSLIRGSNFRC